MTKLILASGSRYKRQQLAQLQLPFEHAAADIDEMPLEAEHPRDTAIRLAEAKAIAVSAHEPNAFVIGCDQTGSNGGAILTKPLSPTRGYEQLRRCSDNVVSFYSAVCLLYPRKVGSEARVRESRVTETKVSFRELSDSQIRNYIKKEEALDCAGGFKIESLGISLFKSVSSDDPSALVGLPLINLVNLLDQAGIHPLN